MMQQAYLQQLHGMPPTHAGWAPMPYQGQWVSQQSPPPPLPDSPPPPLPPGDALPLGFLAAAAAVPQQQRAPLLHSGPLPSQQQLLRQHQQQQRHRQPLRTPSHMPAAWFVGDTSGRDAFSRLDPAAFPGMADLQDALNARMPANAQPKAPMQLLSEVCNKTGMQSVWTEERQRRGGFASVLTVLPPRTRGTSGAGADAPLAHTAGSGANARESKQHAAVQVMEALLAAQPGLVHLVWGKMLGRGYVSRARPAGASTSRAGSERYGSGSSLEQQQDDNRWNVWEREEREAAGQQQQRGERWNVWPPATEPPMAGPPPLPLPQPPPRPPPSEPWQEQVPGVAQLLNDINSHLPPSVCDKSPLQLLNELADKCGLVIEGGPAQAPQPEVEAHHHSRRKHHRKAAPKAHAHRLIVLERRGGREPVAEVTGCAPAKRNAKQVAAALALEQLLRNHSEAAYLAALSARGEPWAQGGGGGGGFAKKRKADGPLVDPNEHISKRFVAGGMQTDDSRSRTVAAAAWPQQPQQPANVPPTLAFAPALSSSNKGYALLKKAGWMEGSGLGAKKQGVTSIIAPAAQQHSKGLGFINTKKKH